MQSTVESTWVILLAAGDGTRLHSLTTKEGVAIPKQFCSLHGERSLLQESLHRALAITSRQHVCAIVAEQHKQWWEPQLRGLPTENIIVQPVNRGTANGILLPLLAVLERDPTARVVLLPCDHYVGDEPVLAESIRNALSHIKVNGAHPVLLGMEPDQPDPDLGYIVPGRFGTRMIADVLKFVEKPLRVHAHHLISRGALWNTFIIASCGRCQGHRLDGGAQEELVQARSGEQCKKQCSHIAVRSTSQEESSYTQGDQRVFCKAACTTQENTRPLTHGIVAKSF